MRINQILPMGRFDATDWQDLLSAAIADPDRLAAILPVARNEIHSVTRQYPMRINPYYLDLIQKTNDPCWRQAVPNIQELDHIDSLEDPLSEEKQTCAPGIIQRYPDRVLFLVSNSCALYCRHCMRKRKLGMNIPVEPAAIQKGLAYIAANDSIKEVVLSGGDPLMMSDQALDDLLKRLFDIAHIELVRIHTRMPCVLPQRITTSLVEVLGQYHPLFMNTQFNHPVEITEASARACRLLVEAGIPLGCQTVLLKGVNDQAAVMGELMRGLVKIRVKPYYLHHPDPVRGTMHFRVPLATGMEIMRAMRGHISGLCIPQYMLDLPGGGGKIPILPEYLEQKKNGIWRICNFEGRFFEFTE